jgi:hypothetical protein
MAISISTGSSASAGFTSDRSARAICMLNDQHQLSRSVLIEQLIAPMGARSGRRTTERVGTMK